MARGQVLSPDMQYKTGTMGKQPVSENFQPFSDKKFTKKQPDPNLEMLKKALRRQRGPKNA